MTVQYGDKRYKSEKIWKISERIKRCVNQYCYYVRSGWPSTVICFEVKEQIDQSIRDNRRISIYDSASEMSVITF
jgi:hypothetical protein